MTTVAQKPARSGRATELVLLAIALAIGLSAWVLVTIGVSDQVLPDGFAKVSIVAAVGVLAVHLGVRKLAPYADPIFLPAAVALNGLGLAMIHRIDFELKAPEVGGQLKLTIVGVVLMVLTLVAIRDHRILRKFTWTSLILGIFLLLLPMAPGIGRTINGARLWIAVGGFTFQPAELAKIMFAIFFAGYLVVQRDNLALAGKKVWGIQLPRLRHLAPILVAWIACLGILVLEKDFGTALLFFGLFVAMLYIATERVSWILIGGGLSLVGVFFVVQMMPHIMSRVTSWLHALDPEVYDAPYGSYQLVQGWFGMASGGLFGTGLGNGYPTKSYAANSDFIIASFGEELGMAGLLAILSIYLLITVRALTTGIRLRDGFGKLLAAGLGFTIALQCFVVVGGVTRVIPLTGLAMPFLALGGSALLTNWIVIGLLLRMSDAARRPHVASSEPLPSIDDFVSDDDDEPTSDTSTSDISDDDAGSDKLDGTDADANPTEVVRL